MIINTNIFCSNYFFRKTRKVEFPAKQFRLFVCPLLFLLYEEQQRHLSKENHKLHNDCKTSNNRSSLRKSCLMCL